MKRFRIHDARSAPTRGARAYLRNLRAERGHVPDILGMLAESEAALRGYAELARQFALSSLTAAERQVVLHVTNRFNESAYCITGDAAIAESLGMSRETILALRAGRSLDDARLEALRRFAQAVLDGRGQVGEEAWDAFTAAGFSPAHALEVVTCVAFKTLANFAARLAELPPSADLPDWARAEAASGA